MQRRLGSVRGCRRDELLKERATSLSVNFILVFMSTLQEIQSFISVMRSHLVFYFPLGGQALIRGPFRGWDILLGAVTRATESASRNKQRRDEAGKCDFGRVFIEARLQCTALNFAAIVGHFFARKGLQSCTITNLNLLNL